MPQTLVMDGAQVARLMKLCRTLGRANGTTLQQLQTRLKMSRRTVFRDLAALQEIGIRLESGLEGYVLNQSSTECKRLLLDHYRGQFEQSIRSWLK